MGINDIGPEERKTKIIRDWKKPTLVTEVHTFLGLAKYYAHFILYYTQVAALLSDLLAKDQQFY